MAVDPLQSSYIRKDELGTEAPSQKDKCSSAPVQLEIRYWLIGGPDLRLPETGMFLLGIGQAAVDFFKRRALFDLGESAIKGCPVSFIEPIGLVLNDFVSFRHFSFAIARPASERSLL
jgi:hypothetical protein